MSTSSSSSRRVRYSSTSTTTSYSGGPTKSKLSTIAVQWVSSVVFIYCGIQLYDEYTSWFKHAPSRIEQTQIWICLMFLTEGIGQIFIGLSAATSRNPNYKYIEYNSFGHISWITFMLTAISRIALGVSSLEIIDNKTLNVGAFAVWLIFFIFIYDNKFRRSITPIMIVGSSLFLGIMLVARYLQTDQLDLVYGSASQLGYVVLLVVGGTTFDYWILEIINIFLWILLFVYAPQVIAYY